MSSSTIFLDNAPRYWERNLSAIPLFRRDKRPLPEGWQRWAETLPAQEFRDSWLATYPDSNLGLVLGVQSNLCMIDIDTEDPVVQKAIIDLLPPSPWHRRGKKGMMLAYRFNGMKTFRIKDAAGNMIVEGLSTGAQVVLPPSIHPDTQKPYVANCDLADEETLRYLSPLPKDIEAIFRSALEQVGIKLSLSGYTRVTDWVSRGARDVQMVGVAGHYANGVLRGELSFKDALARIVAWKSTCVEKVADDDIDIEKGVRKLAEFLIRDVTGPKKRALPDGWDKDLTDEERKGFGFEIFDVNHVQWDYEKILNFISDAFASTTPASAARKTALDEFLSAIARSRDLDQIDVERLLRFVVSTGQMGLTLQALKARLIELRSDGVKGADHAEIAAALLDKMNNEGQVAFWAAKFWQWKGSHWEPLPDSTLMRRIAEDYGHLPAAKKASDHRGIYAVAAVKVARELKQMDEVGINFANGFLTQELRLVEHSPDFGTTYTLPYRYVPELATGARMFESFLHSCWGHHPDFERKKKALREAIAATMFGVTTRFERAFCLFGQAKSGKSQLLKIIASLVPGEVTSAVPPTDWHDKFLPAQMAGKLLNLCGELSERRPIDGMIFKEVISGEKITVQHKGKDPFTVRPSCAHWFASNHLPTTSDTSSGFNRRWLMLTFDRQVSDDEKVLDLGTLIAAEEREAIVAWAVESFPELLGRGEYTKPETHEEAMEEVASGNNSVRMFLKDSGIVVFGPIVSQSDIPVPEQSLFNAYFSFAVAAGVARPASLKKFRALMRELGSEFGFKSKVTQNPAGLPEYVYAGLTLAGRAGTSRRSGTASGPH